MNRALLAAAASVAVLAPAQGAQAQKPQPGAPAVTIAAKPNPVTFSSPVEITGKVDGAPVEVRLQVSATPTGTFTTVATGRTEKNGRYRLVHRPAINTYFRVLAATTPASQSPNLLVRVSPLVGLRVSDSTPAIGQRVRFSGIVRPAHNGRTVQVQRRSATGTWVTVARPTLRAVDSATSRYAVTLRVRRTAVYRTRILGHADHAAGVSRERTLTVH